MKKLIFLVISGFILASCGGGSGGGGDAFVPSAARPAVVSAAEFQDKSGLIANVENKLGQNYYEEIYATRDLFGFEMPDEPSQSPARRNAKRSLGNGNNNGLTAAQEWAMGLSIADRYNIAKQLLELIFNPTKMQDFINRAVAATTQTSETETVVSVETKGAAINVVVNVYVLSGAREAENIATDEGKPVEEIKEEIKTTIDNGTAEQVENTITTMTDTIEDRANNEETSADIAKDLQLNDFFETEEVEDEETGETVNKFNFDKPKTFRADAITYNLVGQDSTFKIEFDENNNIAKFDIQWGENGELGSTSYTLNGDKLEYISKVYAVQFKDANGVMHTYYAPVEDAENFKADAAFVTEADENLKSGYISGCDKDDQTAANNLITAIENGEGTLKDYKEILTAEFNEMNFAKYGFVNVDMYVDNKKLGTTHSVFGGGYEDKVLKSDLNKDMTFKGSAIGMVAYNPDAEASFLPDGYAEKLVRTEKDGATLQFSMEDGKEILTMPFSGWYKVVAIKDHQETVDRPVVLFSDYNETDDRFKMDFSLEDYLTSEMNTTLYGSLLSEIEALSTFSIHNMNQPYYKEFSAVFGGTQYDVPTPAEKETKKLDFFAISHNNDINDILFVVNTADDKVDSVSVWLKDGSNDGEVEYVMDKREDGSFVLSDGWNFTTTFADETFEIHFDKQAKPSLIEMLAVLKDKAEEKHPGADSIVYSILEKAAQEYSSDASWNRDILMTFNPTDVMGNSLRYSNFGFVEKTDYQQQTESPRIFVSGGSYENQIKDFASLQQSLRFNGRAMGELTVRDGDGNIVADNGILNLNTTNAHLDFIVGDENPTEKLSMSFGNWYDVVVMKNGDTSNIIFSNNKNNNSLYRLEQNFMGATKETLLSGDSFDTKYYGDKDKNIIEEAIAALKYSKQFDEENTLKQLDLVFGGTKSGSVPTTPEAPAEGKTAEFAFENIHFEVIVGANNEVEDIIFHGYDEHSGEPLDDVHMKRIDDKTFYLSGGFYLRLDTQYSYEVTSDYTLNQNYFNFNMTFDQMPSEQEFASAARTFAQQYVNQYYNQNTCGDYCDRMSEADQQSFVDAIVQDVVNNYNPNNVYQNGNGYIYYVNNSNDFSYEYSPVHTQSPYARYDIGFDMFQEKPVCGTCNGGTEEGEFEQGVREYMAREINRDGWLQELSDEEKLLYVEAVVQQAVAAYDDEEKWAEHQLTINLDHMLQNVPGNDKLRYSNFGYTDYEETGPHTGGGAIFVAGGLKDHKIDPVNIVKNYMEFKGRAMGSISAQNRYGSHFGEDFYKYLQDDNASLTFLADEDFTTETLNMSFGDWYDVKITKRGNSSDLTFDNFKGENEHQKIFWEKSTIHNFLGGKEFDGGDQYGSFDIGYYGPKGAKNPTEAVASVLYEYQKHDCSSSGDCDNYDIDFELVFGGILNQNATQPQTVNVREVYLKTAASSDPNSGDTDFVKMVYRDDDLDEVWLHTSGRDISMEKDSETGKFTRRLYGFHSTIKVNVPYTDSNSNTSNIQFEYRPEYMNKTSRPDWGESFAASMREDVESTFDSWNSNNITNGWCYGCELSSANRTAVINSIMALLESAYKDNSNWDISDVIIDTDHIMMKNLEAANQANNKLQYSYYGYADLKQILDEKDPSQDVADIREFGAGGRDEYKIDPSKFKSQNFDFAGRAIGRVGVYEGDTGYYRDLATDNARLEFRGETENSEMTETITANFDNWYDVTVVRHNGGERSDISLDNYNSKKTDYEQRFEFVDAHVENFTPNATWSGTNGNNQRDRVGYVDYNNQSLITDTFGEVNIDYYGPAGSNTPTEVVGTVHYKDDYIRNNGQETDLMKDFEMSFGMKNVTNP